MPIDFSLTGQALVWLEMNNLEAALCQLPSFDDVCAGQHWVVAVGNDGMGARIAVETEWVAEHAHEPIVHLAHASYLSAKIRQMRAEELRAVAE